MSKGGCMYLYFAYSLVTRPWPDCETTSLFIGSSISESIDILLELNVSAHGWIMIFFHTLQLWIVPYASFQLQRSHSNALFILKGSSIHIPISSATLLCIPLGSARRRIRLYRDLQ